MAEQGTVHAVEKAPVGVIGGTGVYDPAWLTSGRSQEISTPYGTVAVTRGDVGGRSAVFLNRHGPGHSVPPHRVNYRANLWALKWAGVKQVVATAAVGSLNLALPPGAIMLCDQFLDFTKGRPASFFDGGDSLVVHTDMTAPYCQGIRQHLWAAAQGCGAPAVFGGTYVATEGPRFESSAEIKAYRLLGGDVVGMTGVPEVVLARELGICYATVCLSTNFAAGMTGQPLTHQEVVDLMKLHAGTLRTLLETTLPHLGEDACQCPAPPSGL